MEQVYGDVIQVLGAVVLLVVAYMAAFHAPGWIATAMRDRVEDAVYDGQEAQVKLLLGKLGAVQAMLAGQVALLVLILWRVW